MNASARRSVLQLILAALILANAAGTTLFLRGDLTQNHVYSLSPASRRVVPGSRRDAAASGYEHLCLARHLWPPAHGDTIHGP